MEGKLPRFTNARGEEFFGRYLPDGLSLAECIKARLWHYPFSTRLQSRWFDIGIFTEVSEGRGTPHDGVWADFRGLVDEPAVREAYQTVGEQYRRRIVDAWAAPVELSLMVHAFNGGIRIDQDGRTAVENLFACGECAGGMHSADRLGGMACASTQVFGARAGAAAARTALERRESAAAASQAAREVRRVQEILGRPDAIAASAVRERIQRLMWAKSMICKTEAGLEQCLAELDEIAERDLPRVGAGTEGDVFTALDVANLWQTAHVIASVSRERKESRGPHYRADYPDPDPAFAGSYVVRVARPPRDYRLTLTRLSG